MQIMPILVSLGLIFMIGAMLTARRRKGRRGWLKTHKTLGLLGVSLAIAGVLMAVFMLTNAALGLQLIFR